jgi:dTDP-4-dehydrorhamnose 3,5-epimerase
MGANIMDSIFEPELIKGKVFRDSRGTFVPLSLISRINWIQSNVSVNPKRLTIRGLHFQLSPYAQSKLIKVIDGEIIDFIVDLREELPSYMKLYTYDMEPGDELYVPRGFAHGFITTKDNTIIQYLVDNTYSPDSEGSIVWTKFLPLMQKFNTIPEFNIHDITINDKDLITKNFND